MLGRWVAEAIRPGVVIPGSKMVRSDKKWMKDARQYARKAFGHAAMKTHLSQSSGAGAFDGQHGISLAISSVVADGDISSAIACIDMSEDIPAITGWESGANARPAITRIASSRRMVKLYFTSLGSHKLAAMESPRGCAP
jgi:hypothetical protein